MPRKQKKKAKKQRQKKSNNTNNINSKYYTQKKSKKKKNKKKNEIEEQFKKHLEELGYFIREVGGDGNCLFRSVSEQMEGNENKYKEYREKCVNYIAEHKDEFAPFIVDDETIDEYIERMSKNTEWGGNLEIYALSKALEVNFYIYKEDKQMYIVENFEKPKKNITLTFQDGKHYNSLRKLEEKNKNDKEKEEKKKKEKEKEENEENEDSDDDEDNEEDEKDVNDDIKDLISKVDHLNI